MRNDVIEHIGSCIWEARRHKGYSRRVLSEKTGLSERTIEKIEKGKVNTTAETLYTLINALDMSADYLFKMDKHQADAKCEQVINMLMACDENQKDVVCRTMQTLIEAMRGGENWGGSRKRFITRLIIFGCAHRRRCLDRRRILMIRR